jgi:hypothetical protein
MKTYNINNAIAVELPPKEIHFNGSLEEMKKISKNIEMSKNTPIKTAISSW